MSLRVSRRTITLVLLLAACGIAPVWLTLTAPVASEWEGPLAVEDASRTGIPLEFPLEPATGPARTGAILVAARDTSWLREADELRVLFATYETAPILKVARLRSADGACEFATDTDVPLRNNAPLVFKRVQCDTTEPQLEMTLFVRLGETGRAALWSFPAGQSPAEEPLIVSAPDGSWHQTLRGTMFFGERTPAVTRLDLIAYLWQTRTSRVAIWGITLALLALVGIVLLTTERMAPVGMAVAACALAAAWAIVIPPLQGADEPDHLLSFAEVTGAPEVAEHLEWFARRSHFERLRFHGDERFRPRDRVSPHPVAWTGDVHAERMDNRSPTAVRLWRVAAAMGIRNTPLPDLLLLVRLFNALVFGLAVGVAGVALRWAGVSGRAWALVGLALIPTLASFAVMLSDWAFVASWSIWLTASLLLLIDDGPRASWAGLGLGVSTALLASTSIGALALAPLIGAVIAGRLVLGGPMEPGHGWTRSPKVFWVGLAAGGTAGYLLAHTLFTAGFQRYDATGNTFADLLAFVNQTLATIAEAPWLLLVAVAVLAGVDLAMAPARRHAAVARLGRLAASAVAVVVGGAVCLTAVLSLVIRLPIVGTLPDPRYASATDYVLAVLLSVVTLGRLRGFDHLTFSSFWSGFGWIDAVMPDAGLVALAALMIAASAGSMIVWQRGGRYRALGWVGIILAGAIGSAVAYAAAGYLMNRNVHGRYLLGLAVPLIGVLAAGAGAWLAHTPRSTARLAAAGIIIAIHGGSLAWVLTRYF